MNYLLGIDQGTTQTTAVVVNERGELIEKNSAQLPARFPQAGWVEQEPHDIVRTVKEACAPLLSKYDIIIVPSMADEPMALTCLTGNPCITLPAGIAAAGGAPPSITFIGGKLYSEAIIAAFAKKFQQLTHYQQQHPLMFTK